MIDACENKHCRSMCSIISVFPPDYTPLEIPDMIFIIYYIMAIT